MRLENWLINIYKGYEYPILYTKEMNSTDEYICIIVYRNIKQYRYKSNLKVCHINLYFIEYKNKNY